MFESLGGQNKNNDIYDEVEGTDIFGRFNEAWADKILKKQKWLEKKESLEEFINAANAEMKLANN